MVSGLPEGGHGEAKLICEGGGTKSKNGESMLALLKYMACKRTIWDRG